MLFLNGNPLKFDTPQGRQYNTFVDTKLKKMKNPVVFKSGKPVKINATGLFEPPRQEWIPFSTTVGGEHGSETWQYTSVLPIKRNDQWIFSERGRVYNHGRKLKLDKNKDPELIFYLSELSPFIKSGKIVLENKEHEARTIIDKEIGILDVKWFIYSEHSPISVRATANEDALRTIASSWGVGSVDELSISEVQLALHKVVERSHSNIAQTGRGYTEFLSETKVNDLVILRANIQKAIDKGLIEYVPMNLQWQFASSDHILMTIAPKDIAVKEMALFNYVKVRPDIREMLMAELSDSAYGKPQEVEEEVPELPDAPEVLSPEDLEELVTATVPPSQQAAEKPKAEDLSWVDNVKRADLDGMKRRELEKVCKKHVINSFGKKTEELVDKLKTIYTD